MPFYCLYLKHFSFFSPLWIVKSSLPAGFCQVSELPGLSITFYGFPQLCNCQSTAIRIWLNQHEYFTFKNNFEILPFHFSSPSSHLDLWLSAYSPYLLRLLLFMVRSKWLQWFTNWFLFYMSFDPQALLLLSLLYWSGNSYLIYISNDFIRTHSFCVQPAIPSHNRKYLSLAHQPLCTIELGPAYFGH